METARYISFSIAARAQLADEAPLSSSSSHLRDGSLNPPHDRYPRFILSLFLSFSFIVIHVSSSHSQDIIRPRDLEGRSTLSRRGEMQFVALIFVESPGYLNTRAKLALG